MEKYALVSVFDKTNLLPLAQALQKAGYRFLSTGGSAEFLRKSGFEVIQVSDFTGYPEICDGRVKSLHPKIHGGILARRDNPNDMKQLAGVEAGPIDVVVVNLYPFQQKVNDVLEGRAPREESLVEHIDIGGPTIIRAAAKNWRFVAPVCSPDDYPVVIEELQQFGEVQTATRQRLAAKVFSVMAAYDSAVARYFSLQEKLFENEKPVLLAPFESLTLERVLPLRYGENPHQAAALYRRARGGLPPLPALWEQLQGKELSFNNLIDLQAAVELFLDLRAPFSGKEAAVIIKHTNPCGTAVASSPDEAFVRARACDPVSAFGGIIAISGTVTKALVQQVLEGFVEVFVASNYEPAALELFATKKNVRVIRADFETLQRSFAEERITCRDFFGDLLLQTADATCARVSAENVVSGTLAQGQLENMEFAWRVCKHVKSNAIVIVKELQGIGVGAGQMSRVDSARIALQRAASHGFDVRGAVAASDAFLPFPDTLEILAEADVVALVQPGGSMRDNEVIEAAKRLGVTMVFTGERHFRH